MMRATHEDCEVTERVSNAATRAVACARIDARRETCHRSIPKSCNAVRPATTNAPARRRRGASGIGHRACTGGRGNIRGNIQIV